jgi:hemerythrin superfamily protein
MPTSRQKAASRGARSSSRADDAVALLKADHREVEGWFEQFEKTRTSSRKQELADKICSALKVHATIEEEIFYPAFYEATEEKELHHEAEIEHEGAKELIAKIEESSPDDDYFVAKVKVLSEMIKHHVKEEERPDGMFAKAKKSEMDLEELGRELRVRKMQLQNGAASRRPARAGTQLE